MNFFGRGEDEELGGRERFRDGTDDEVEGEMVVACRLEDGCGVEG